MNYPHSYTFSPYILTLSAVSKHNYIKMCTNAKYLALLLLGCKYHQKLEPGHVVQTHPLYCTTFAYHGVDIYFICSVSFLLLVPLSLSTHHYFIPKFSIRSHFYPHYVVKYSIIFNCLETFPPGILCSLLHLRLVAL